MTSAGQSGLGHDTIHAKITTGRYDMSILREIARTEEAALKELVSMYKVMSAVFRRASCSELIQCSGAPSSVRERAESGEGRGCNVPCRRKAASDSFGWRVLK